MTGSGTASFPGALPRGSGAGTARPATGARAAGAPAGGSRAPAYPAPVASASHSARTRSRSTLPAALRGSSATTRILRGTL